MQLAELTAAPGEADEQVAADRVILALIAALRLGTIALAIAAVSGGGDLRRPTLARLTLGALAAQSAVGFGAIVGRLRRRRRPVFPPWVAVAEFAGAVASLLAVGYSTQLAAHATSSNWAEQYTVISCVVIAAACRPRWGAIAALTVAGCYLVSVTAIAPGASRLPDGVIATALANALSYVPFWAVAVIGFGVLRSTIDERERLRRELRRLEAERARIAAAGAAYRIGHDIPKAIFREIRRGTLTLGELRTRAVESRTKLVEAMGDRDRAAVSLAGELRSLVAGFADTPGFAADLTGLRDTPADAPAVLFAQATRELLNNAAYHAYGYPIRLTAVSTGEAVSVRVANGGPGINPLRLTAKWALGRNTVHQLEAAGASYTIDSAPGEDTGVTVTLRWVARR